jgi:hypothetical protein
MPIASGPMNNSTIGLISTKLAAATLLAEVATICMVGRPIAFYCARLERELVNRPLFNHLKNLQLPWHSI